MWCNIGDEDSQPTEVGKKIKIMLDSYEMVKVKRKDLVLYIHKQIDRISRSIFPTETQTIATRQWANECNQWLYKHQELIECVL